jgi:histidinol-phosphatase (PHP family)
MIPADLHVHPDYSIDAASSIEDYCVRAKQIGLRVIGFSTHYDINPARDDLDPFMIVDGEKVRADDYALGRYLDDCIEAREQFPELQVLAGLEVDYFPGVEAIIYRLKSEFDFDYLIGSVHCLEGISISYRDEAAKYFNVNPLGKMADKYFDLLYNAANCGLFDVIGHADYYLRHGAYFYGQEILNIHRERLAKVIEAAKRTNTGFEINTSYYRHGGDTFYPHPDFLRMLASAGVKINSIGSDAHKVDDLASGIVDAIKTLESINVRFSPFYETNQA